MAQSITITIQDDAKAAILLKYACMRYGYKDTVNNPDFDAELPEDPQTNPSTIPNPETKKMFVKRWTIRWWREVAIAGWQKEQQQLADAEFDETNITID